MPWPRLSKKGVLQALPRQCRCLRKWTLTCSDQVPEVQVLNLQLQVLSLGVLVRQPKCLWVEVFLRLEHLFSFQSRLRPLWVRTNCSS